MFARKPDNVSRSEITAETVSTLAAAVGKGPLLQLAETNLSELRGKRDSLRAEEQAQINDHLAAGRSILTAQANAVTDAIRALEQQIKETRPRVSELRRARADRINDALLSIQKETAARIVAAYDDLTAATDILIACNEEVRKAGDPDRPHLYHVVGVTLIDHARRLLK